MANWQKNNRAHAGLCFFEKWHHEQPDVKFTPAGQWSTNYLIKSASGESENMRADKAQAHAELLDGAFKSLFVAKYEEGIDRDAALAAILQVLNDSSKKLEDLGDPVDECYQFIGEV